ncbi:MAG: EthD family reductase [Actinomycetota bacterium]
MSFKAVILLRRRDDMSAEEFRRWWLHEHAPLAAQLPGVRRIVFNAAVDDPPGGADDVDGVSELWFDSEADFVAAYATELGQQVAADSMAHVRGRTRLFVTEHDVVSEV